MKSIIVTNLTKKYIISQGFLKKQEQYLYALKNISFEVNQGEIFGIIGKNGSGKSTLLKILSKITLPTSGNAVLQGKVSSLLEVGTGFHEDLTGRENVFMNGIILGMKRHEIYKYFDEIVQFAGVEQFIDMPVKKYSSGMRLRLAFSVAAHLRSDILLVDEVLSIGDYEFEKKCMGIMGDIQKLGRTILFVSHNIEHIKRLCHRGILLSKGDLIQKGSVSDVINTYYGKHITTTSIAQWSHGLVSENGILIIREIKILNVDEFNQVAREDSLLVSTTFDVIESGLFMGLVFSFFNEDGVLMFVACESQEIDLKKTVSIGRYTVVCKVPSNIFKEGKITISLRFENAGKSNKLILDSLLLSLDAIISCNVISRVKNNMSILYDNSGIIKPSFEWKKTRINL